MSKVETATILLSSYLCTVFFLLTWGFCYETLGFRQNELSGLFMLLASLVCSAALSIYTSSKLSKL